MLLRRAALLALALVSATSLPGCLIGGHSNTEIHGTYVGAETISQIPAGKTADYGLARLGEPDSKTPVGNGAELWKWGYSERKTSGGSVLLVFGASNNTERRSTAYVELRDGVVVHAWRD
jgi:outer membrane protein assembly factor BamE (lipoprotein component of BamABCDE complex)